MDLPNPETEPSSPALQVDSLLAELPGKNINLGVFLYLMATLVFLRPEFNLWSSNYQREKVTLCSERLGTSLSSSP